MPLTMIRARWLSIGSLVLCLLAGATTASAQTEGEEQARAHFRLGRAHYDNGDFLRAAQEFESAFAISQHSQLLYNIYLAYRDANVTRKAAEALKGYLEQVQDVPNRAQLAARLESLEQSLANEPAQPAQATPTPADTAAQATPTTETTSTDATTTLTPEETASRGGKSKLLPIILMGTGGALIVGGVITGIMSSGKASDLEKLCPAMSCSAENSDAGRELQSSGQTLALVTDILLIGGIAAAGTGAVLFFLAGRKDSSEPPPATASVACGPGMCGGTVQLRF